MGRKTTKRPQYDGTACLLYDFMVARNMTEEKIMQAMGLKVDDRTPWHPVSLWIMHPESLSQEKAYMLCKALNATFEAIYLNSMILNGRELQFRQRYIERAKRHSIKDIDDLALIEEIKRRGYKVYKEI